MACLLDRSFCGQVLPHSRSAFLRMSHILHLPEVALASAPVPICSKIWEVCFDVNTVLVDSPINSGGATRSRHCSLLGRATRTRSDAATCVLPSDANCTRHDDAFSSNRLTVPCDSDFLCVSLIRDGLASQHARLPTVLHVLFATYFRKMYKNTCHHESSWTPQHSKWN